MDIFSFLGNYVVLFLALMSLLVFVHEFGHYGIARAVGVRAEVFSIGFGPEIIGWTSRKTGTRWRLAAIPLGGYVKFVGDMTPSSAGGVDEKLPAEARRYAFHLQPVWKRAAIVFAGPAANLLFAWALTAVVLYSFGQAYTLPKVGAVDPGSPAAQGDIRPGDELLAFNGKPLRRFEEFEQEVQIRPNTAVDVTIRRDGVEQIRTITLEQREFIDRFKNVHRLGRSGLHGPNELPYVGRILPQAPAEGVGIEVGDRILEVDGVKVERFSDIPRLLRGRASQDTAIVVERGGRTMSVSVVPRPFAVQDEPEGAGPAPARIGIMSGYFTESQQFDAPQAAVAAVRTVARECSAFYTLLRQLLLGMRPLDELSGPMRMAKATGEVAQIGWRAVLGFAIVISVLLGLFNLLPIPLLDGGHLLYYAIETIRGRPLGPRAQEYGFRLGFALVACATLLATWNDVAAIFGHLAR
jgi:regulator of sigma E protease